MWIGVSASLLLLALGRVAGISGIVSGVLLPTRGDLAWRVAFVGGLVVTGAVLAMVWPARVAFDLDRSTVTVVVAGLLVGFGTRMGGGCTSGHGVCGLAHLSPRALVATLTFMATGMLTVFAAARLAGGGS
jgi:hypothetical protein